MLLHPAIQDCCCHWSLSTCLCLHLHIQFSSSGLPPGWQGLKCSSPGVCGHPRACPPLSFTEAGAQSHHAGPQRPCHNLHPFSTKPGAYTPHLPELKPLHTLGLTNNPPRENESWGAQTASVNRSSTKDRHMWDIRLWINKMGTFVSVSSPKWSNLGLRAKSSEMSSIFLLQFIIFLWITGDIVCLSSVPPNFLWSCLDTQLNRKKCFSSSFLRYLFPSKPGGFASPATPDFSFLLSVGEEGYTLHLSTFWRSYRNQFSYLLPISCPLPMFPAKHGMRKAHWYTIIPSFSSGKRSEPRLECFSNSRSHAKKLPVLYRCQKLPNQTKVEAMAFLFCHYSLFQPTSSRLCNSPIQKGSDTTEIFCVCVLTVLPEVGKCTFKINGKLRCRETE